MVFALFRKKDPICGMKEEKGKGIMKHGNWFCSDACLRKFESGMEKASKGSCGCCH